MWPVLGSLITGGASLLGGMFSSDTSAKNTEANIAMQRETNTMNMQESQRNRDFQERMSNSAYQRASADMQLAGLNPMMMFGSGSAASAPTGSTATAQAPKSELRSPLAGIGDAAEKAVSTALNIKSMERMTEETANLIVQRMKTEADTKVSQAVESNVKERTHLTATEAARLQNLMPSYRFEGKGAEVLEKLANDHPEIFKWLKGVKFMSDHTRGAQDQIGDVFSSAFGAAKGLKHLYSGSMFGRDNTGLSPSQVRDLYNKFKAMDGG